MLDLDFPRNKLRLIGKLGEKYPKGFSSMVEAFHLVKGFDLYATVALEFWSYGFVNSRF